MIDPNKVVIPSIQLTQDNDDTLELRIRLGALDIRADLTLHDFASLMRGKVVYPKANFVPITGNVKNFKKRGSYVTLDADTLGMPTLDEDGHYLPAADRLKSYPAQAG